MGALQHTMLFVGLFKDSFVIQEILNLGEQVQLLVIVVRLDEFEPRQGIAHKIGLVGVAYVRRLQINAIEATKDGIVQQRHVARARDENIAFGCCVLLTLIERIHGRLDQLHGPVSPGFGAGCGCGGHHEGRAGGE